MKILLNTTIIAAIALISFQCSEKETIEKPCKYGDIVLDTNNLVIIDSNDLKGGWELVGYINLTDCSFLTKGDSIDKPTKIFFTDPVDMHGTTVNMNGNTTCNDFWGTYKLDTGKMKLIKYNITLVYRPGWDEHFHEVFEDPGFITIQNNTLFIYNRQSTKVMILGKIQ